MKKFCIGRFSVVFGVFIGIVFAFSITSVTFADDSGVDRVTVTVPVACTFQGINNSHSESVSNGRYYSNIGGSSTLTVNCNDSGGFSIYAIGNSNGEEGNNRLVGNNGSSIATGSPSYTSSNWHFKVEKTSSSDSGFVLEPTYASGQFVSVPSSWDKIATKESGTTSSGGISVNATYGVYIDSTQLAGAYSGQVKYIMVHPYNSSLPVSLSMAFANNGKNKVSVVDSSTGVTHSYYKMQDMNPTICSQATVFGEESQTELIDIRDNKVYWVAKLDDNRCWMTENLDLDLSSSVALTSDDTNLKLYGSDGYDDVVVDGESNGYSCSNDSPTCENGIISWTPERSTTTMASLSTDWEDSYFDPYSFDRGDYLIGSSDNGHNSAGNYYNWSASIASNNSSSYVSDRRAGNSICPKGWRLPDTSNKDLSKLLYAYGIIATNSSVLGYVDDPAVGFKKMTNAPLYFTNGGMVNKSGIVYNSNGYYWLGSAGYDNSASRYLYFNNNSLYLSYGYSGHRSYGAPIRCLAE